MAKKITYLVFLLGMAFFCTPNPEELLKKAIDLRLEGKYEEAKKLLDKALAQEPSAEVYKELGNYYLLAQENLDEAEKNYNLALEKDPKYLNALHNLGTVYLKRYEKTQDEFGKGEKLYLEKAKGYLDRALEINPNFALSWQEMARYYFYTKNYNKAIETIEKGINLDSKSARAYLIAGQIYLKGKKDFNKAHRYFEQAYAYDRNMNEALFYLYITSKRQNKQEDADFYYQEYFKLLSKQKLAEEEIKKEALELEKALYRFGVNIEEPKNR